MSSLLEYIKIYDFMRLNEKKEFIRRIVVEVIKISTP